MSGSVDFYFSYRSPYSYLAAPRAFALPDSYDIELNFFGVTPMAMRGQSVPQAKRVHTIRDTAREAARLGTRSVRVPSAASRSASSRLIAG